MSASSTLAAPPKSTSKADGLTPMLAQYLELKDQAGDALLFFRMGDFYELFFGDAAAASQALDIALTKRGTYQGEDIPMCGVPAASAESYLQRLIAAGFRVAVCEQMEDPAEARKRGAKSVVARAIVRTVTPGTVTEDALLEARAPAHLVAVAPQGDGDGLVGVAWADVSTGAFCLTEASCEEAAALMAALAPREVLWPDGGHGAAWAQELCARLGAAGTPWAARSFAGKAGAERLCAIYDVATLDGFGVFSALECGAGGALAEYLAMTQAGGPVRLCPPEHRQRADHMVIDPTTRASLEIDRTMAGSRAGSLLDSVDRTVTSPGGRLLAQWIAQPLVQLAGIGARQDSVTFFAEQAGARSQVRSALRGAGDAARALSRLVLGRGGPRDLVQLAAALRAGEAARVVIEAHAPPGGTIDAPLPALLARACDALRFGDDPVGVLLARIDAVLVDAPPVQVSDGGFVRANADPALDAARSLRDESRAVVARLEGDLRERTGVGALKIKHNGVLGYFVEAPARHGETLRRDAAGVGFVHRQTLANVMRFTTPELAELEAKIAAAGEEVRRRELALFAALVSQVESAAEGLRAAGDGLALIDVAAAGGQWADDVGAVRPVLEDSGAFSVEAGRHPVVEAAVTAAGETYTTNDCVLDAAGSDGARLTLVTGPNMAGKSTYLRQNAVIAILAQAGWFAPARSARIGVVDRVFSRVGAGDDLARGRSTFMMEMVETAAILNQAGPRALVILDEVGRGTSTYDGLAIAWATVEHLHNVNQCRSLFATHYHELTQLAADLPHADNACLRAKEWKGELVFLHEVAQGAADRSYGVEVARRAGLPGSAVARAKAVLVQLEAGEATGAPRLEELPLFSAVAEPEPAALDGDDPVVLALRALDLDDTTPREALDVLYRLRALAEGKEHP